MEYILCLIIIIIKSEVWTITHCLWLGHETMVRCVSLYILMVIITTLWISIIVSQITKIALWVDIVEDPLISFQCAIMVTHNTNILNVHDPIMNDIHNYSMDIHMQLWMWYPYTQLLISMLFKNQVRMSLNELRISTIELQIYPYLNHKLNQGYP